MARPAIWIATSLLRLLDTSVPPKALRSGQDDKTEWLRILPFIALHLGCFAVIWVGWSPVAVGVAVALYGVHMFAITGWYHRYFSHRTFKTSRTLQAIMAFVGATAVQRGPLWWAAHHRHHHRHSDELEDTHSPRQRGFLWSHMGWFTGSRNFLTRHELVKDLARFPELRFINRWDALPPLVLAVSLYALGALLPAELGTSGTQMFVWGFLISTVVCSHATYTINSLAHVFGKRRYATSDDSRNSLLLALITMGEGWHNNHHHYPASARQGFFWWEIDVTWYVLKVWSWLGLIWDLNPVPREVLGRNRDDAVGLE
jgi:stearoyl-CoA desaturase (delta-9 desaturase)